MSIDYLNDSKTLIHLLGKEGQGELAMKLQECLDAASTSTELLMRLRYTLQSDNGNLSELAGKRAERLIAGINDILK